MHKILVIAGTRPEAIKTVAVIRALQARSKNFDVILCATGQHKEMLAQSFADFNITPNVHLDAMTPNQSLSHLSARLFERLDKLYGKLQPDAVLVQGDTTTVQVAALAAFYRGISVGHIEAGLRSHNMLSPFPEELNRRVAGLVASWHFAPTELSRQNLLSEGIPQDSIIVTGNTVIDALLWMRDMVRKNPPPLPDAITQAVKEHRRIILVTGHRRESFGQGLQQICQALVELSSRFPQDRIIYPVHLNPNVSMPVHELLGGRPGIILCPPQGYKSFVRLMDISYLIITDSGGIQEEGPSLGKPVLVTRELTERPEGVEVGVNFLVGTKVDAIVTHATNLLTDVAAYGLVASIQNPYGDGTAGEKITTFLLNYLNKI